MEGSFSLFVVFVLSLLVVSSSDEISTVFNVVDYGAVGDGQTDDTQAFVKAWQATCAAAADASRSSSYPTMHVPSDKTFLIRPLVFHGPCNSTGIHVEINGNLVAFSEPSGWKCEDNSCDRWIHFHRVDGLNVVGHGIIDGRGKKWWQLLNQKRPTAFEISSSNNVYLGGGLNFKDSPRMHVVLNNLESVSVSNITIDTPEDSPNTDGIHVTGCTNAVIDRCRIGTGDDCISIVDGSSFVTTSNIICGPGHGISIGSLGKHGADDKVEYVKVSDAVFIGTLNGARIKTWQGGKGYARNILFERILSHDSNNPIIINQFYCDHEQCVTSESAVQITNVTFREILGTSKGETAVRLDCSESFPCKDIVVEDIHLLGKDEKNATYKCNNVYGIAQGRKIPYLPCLNQK